MELSYWRKIIRSPFWFLSFWRLRITIFREFLGGLVAKTPSSQFRQPGFYLWSGNQIPQATAKSLHAITTDLTCCNKDQHSQINDVFKKRITIFKILIFYLSALCLNAAILCNLSFFFTKVKLLRIIPDDTCLQDIDFHCSVYSMV